MEIRSAAGAVLYSHPFALTFETIPHKGRASTGPSPLNLRVPFPAGATRAEIRHGETPIWSGEVSANAPTVAFGSPNGGSYDADGVVPVTWNASDADGDALQFRLEYSADDGATWMLINPYMVGNSFDWQPGHLPAGNIARLRLQASDGFTSTTALLAPFTLNPAAPWAMITVPEDGSVFPEGKTIALAGNSTTSQGADTWTFQSTRTDTAEDLGATPTATYTLGGPGVYNFELEVTADGMSDTATVSITVVGDYNHDGMGRNAIPAEPTQCG